MKDADTRYAEMMRMTPEDRTARANWNNQSEVKPEVDPNDHWELSLTYGLIEDHDEILTLMFCENFVPTDLSKLRWTLFRVQGDSAQIVRQRGRFGMALLDWASMSDTNHTASAIEMANTQPEFNSVRLPR